MNKQLKAQVEFAPATTKKRTQHKMILDAIAEKGSISPWVAFHVLHCSKLSTRIGEIEKRAGKRFDREKMFNKDEHGKNYFVGLQYSVPKGMTIKDFAI